MSVLLLSIIVSSASGIFIELESSTIGSEPNEYSATWSNSASVSNLVSVPNLDNAAGIIPWVPEVFLAEMAAEGCWQETAQEKPLAPRVRA